MDKLRPIIENKFWIFFGVVLILPVVGWWPSANQKTQDIDKQIKGIDQSFSTATKDRTKVGNDQWLEEINKVNELKKQKLALANYEIWKRQKEHYVWPDEYIADKLKNFPRVTGRNYKLVDKRVPYAYTKFYPKEITKLYESLNPYKAIGTGDENLKESGVIAVRGEEAFPVFDYSNWDDSAPNMIVVWEAQEDLWLLSSIIDAINKMNEGSVSISDSTIKVIVGIDFMGGQGRGHKQPSSEEANAGNDQNQTPAAVPDTPSNGIVDLPLAYHPGEVFGLQQGTLEAKNMERRQTRALFSGGGGDRKGDSGPRKSRKPASGLGSYTRSVRRNPEGANRYVDLYAKTAPYYTRGFHLHLIMDHRKIPQFIEELSKSPWLIQVLRYQYQNARAVGDLDLIVPIAELTEDPNHKEGETARRRKFGFGAPSRGGSGKDGEDYDNVRKDNNKTNPQAPQIAPVREKKNGYELALTDPYLAEVYISGKFYIYMPAKAPEGLEENQDNTEVTNADSESYEATGDSAEDTGTESGDTAVEEETGTQDEPAEVEEENNNTKEEKPAEKPADNPPDAGVTANEQ